MFFLGFWKANPSCWDVGFGKQHWASTLLFGPNEANFAEKTPE